MVLPLLKWAGGKRWLLDGEKMPRPRSFVRYVEPFFGSGAVYFRMMPKDALISDLNSDLINFYVVLREYPVELQRLMQKHQEAHSRNCYYLVRSSTPEDALSRAARFLYLNRTCWNGLYRVNKLGQFNVPIGTKTAVVMESDDFVSASELLRGAEILSSDFEAIVDRCQEGDFLFVDPPYTVKHNFNGFLKYNENIFGWDDQLRLHEALIRAARRNVMICVTNADHVSVRDLYADFEFSVFTRQSVLAGRSTARGVTTEAMFTLNL